MLNILMINFPAEGHVNPTLSLVKAFTERGIAYTILQQNTLKAELKIWELLYIPIQIY